jgi:hypothetical protein
VSYVHAWSWSDTLDDQGGRVNGPIHVAADGRTEHIVNALVVPQGPNYALAKTLQHWRAVVERCVACPVIKVSSASGFGERPSERQSANNHLIQCFAWGWLQGPGSPGEQQHCALDGDGLGRPQPLVCVGVRRLPVLCPHGDLQPGGMSCHVARAPGLVVNIGVLLLM